MNNIFRDGMMKKIRTPKMPARPKMPMMDKKYGRARQSRPMSQRNYEYGQAMKSAHKKLYGDYK